MAKAFEGSNPSPRTLGQTLENKGKTEQESFEEFLEDKRLAESTIKTKTKIIRMLRKKVNLWDSEEVREFIVKKDWSGKRRNNVNYAYKDWCMCKGFDYEFKIFREKIPPLPYIPTEKELDILFTARALELHSLKEKNSSRLSELPR